MECPNCGFVSPTEMRFCGKCGTNLSQRCAHCNQFSPLDYRFCGHCGAPLAGLAPEADAPAPPFGGDSPGETPPPRSPRPDVALLSGERRPATVLIADVKGSTGILEKIGSEAWVIVMNQALQKMAAAIYRFGGVVDQFRGDGLVAFFGARSAHEDDPERAVLAALAMQSETRSLAGELRQRYEIELLIRVGVHTGEVITASIGNRGEHAEDTAMGEAVTLAARLEAAAEPGTVLVSEHTYRLVEARFSWKSLGELAIRGMRQPLEVYRPLNPLLEAEQQLRLQAYGLSIPMVGRDVELQAIENAICQVREGIGGVILLSGEAGMGKSRLIFEARQRVARDEALLGEKEGRLTWLQGRCRSYGQTLPDSMWVDMWQRWLGLGRWVSQPEAQGRLREQARELWGDQFEMFYPHLAAFLSLPLEEPYAEQIRHLDAEGLRRQFFVAVRSWLEAMSRQNPLVVVFTEVHWADEASLELLKYCLSLSLHERVLFVAVYRPERGAPIWRFQHFVETEYFHRLTMLQLLPLDEAQSRDLVEQMVGADVLSAPARARILEKANGNPYYLTELVRSLTERGVLAQDPASGRWQVLEDDVSLNLPNSLKSLLLARIDRLSTNERRTLQLAAVIGPIFWFNVLEQLAENRGNLRAQLAAMQRVQLIVERGLLPDLGREYAFSSSLIRDAAYESILSSQRADLHRSVAEYLEQIVHEGVLKQYHGLVAYHYHQAGNCQKELFHILLAAQEAQRVHANAEAIHAYQHALTLLETNLVWDCVPSEDLLENWRLEALCGLGQIQFGIGEVQAAEKRFREAIAIGRKINMPAPELTRLFYWLGEVLIWQNAYEEPIHLGEEGLALLGERNESIEAALMNQLVAVGCAQLGDHDKFIDFTLRTAGFIQRLPYAEELRPAFDHIISLYGHTLKNVPEARRWLEILRQKADEHFDLRALGEYYEYSAVLTFREGNPAQALPYHRKAIEKFGQIGDSKHASRAWKSLGVSQLQLGEVEAANASFDQALEIAAVFANQSDYAIGYWYKGQALLCLRQWEAAIECFERAGRIVREVPYLREEWALSGVGRVYLAQGQKEKARAVFQAALRESPKSLFQNSYQANLILSGLERAYENGEDFCKFVDQFREAHPEIHGAGFKQWYLTEAQLSPLAQGPLHYEVFGEALAPGWAWSDPLGDCGFRVRSGLELWAANERNLHHVNRSAPRLLRTEAVQGDFTAQTICLPAAKNKLAIGGLLVWLHEKYWFALEVGGRYENEIILRGFMNNYDFVFGRGQLRGRKTYLRLERRGNWLSAFCSSRGKDWFYAGGCELSTREPLQLGVHAIGHINRMVYPAPHPQGTAIRFEAFWLWGG